MNVLLLNTHSLFNAGDAAIVQAQLDLIAERLPGASVALTSRTPRLDGPVLEPRGVRVLPPLLPARLIPRGERSHSELVAVLRKSDLVLASGGGYLWSDRRGLPGPVFLQNVLPLIWARRLKKPLVFLPQSFGPVRSGPAMGLLNAAVRSASILRFFPREEPSFIFLNALLDGRPGAGRIDLCPDAAFALRERAGEGPDIDPGLPGPILAVSLRAWSFPEARSAAERRSLADGYFKAMLETARGFHQRTGGSVFVFPQVRGPWTFEDDRLISRRFEAELRGAVPPGRVRFIDLPDAVHPTAIVRLLGRADAVLTTRLHAAILSALAGRPPAVVGYQAKSAGTMALLGRSSACLEIGRLEAGPLLAQVERSLEEGRDPRALRARAAALGSDVRAKIGAALTSFAEGRRP